MAQADYENMLLQAPRDSAGSWGQKKVQNPASLVKGPDSRAFSHQTFTMSVIIQMEFSCIEKNTVSGIRLIGQKYQAKLVLEPAKLLGAWRHCLHASADSRTVSSSAGEEV